MIKNSSTSGSERSFSGSKKVHTLSTSFEDSDTKSQNQDQSSRNAPKTLQSGSTGMSFAGLMASKRLARRLTSRFLGRSTNTFSSSRMSATGSVVQKEPTYRLEPHKKFSSVLVKNTLKTFLSERLEGFRYSAKLCSKLCKTLSEEVKEKVKMLKFDRYKIVAVVMIGEKSSQGTVVASEAVWNPNVDSFATYTYENKEIYCTAIVYGLYNE